jgi:hypothetical protein
MRAENASKETAYVVNVRSDMLYAENWNQSVPHPFRLLLLISILQSWPDWSETFGMDKYLGKGRR